MTDRCLSRFLLVASVVLIATLFRPVLAQSTETPSNARDLFFEGLDLREKGDTEGALARFQLALSRDPLLHQARLHVAECFFDLEMYEEAIREAQAYLDADFDMAEVNRAHTLIGLCSLELRNMPIADAPVDTAVQEVAEAPEVTEVAVAAAPESTDGVTTADGVANPVEPATEQAAPVLATGLQPGPAAPSWAPAVVYTGVAVSHIANTTGLTTVGPVLGARFLPVRFLEIGVRARLGFGPHSERGGTIRVPDLGVGAAASIPVGSVRIHLGAMMPVVFSGYGGETRADVGVTGEIGIRVAARGTRLVIGGQFEAGYLVRPMVAGGFCVGVQIGPLR